MAHLWPFSRENRWGNDFRPNGRLTKMRSDG